MEYGLIGEKLGHSFSPEIHQRLGNSNYCLKELAPTELEAFLTAKNFKGINITIPYKKVAMKFCDFITPEAQEIGSINTIINKDGKLYGYNNDYYGLCYIIQSQKISLQNKKVVILGSGGTSLTAQTVAKHMGAAEIIIVSRSGSNNYENLSLHKDAQILINTTPVGMFPNVNESPIDINSLPRVEAVFDAIYNPLCTKLLFQAKSKGIIYSNGLAMLVAQAKKTHELFFDLQLDDSLIDNITQRLSLKNLVLIGMPGCGKTTMGNKIAKHLDLTFVDTDKLIEEKYAMPISQIFETKGEDFFRDAESTIIQEIIQKEGQVIATGGGSILRENNRFNLCQNGTIIWLDRTPEKLSRAGRPLSVSLEALVEMKKTRDKLYQSIADFKFSVNAYPNVLVPKIINAIQK